jgi:hypothetical protein
LACPLEKGHRVVGEKGTRQEVKGQKNWLEKIA